MKCSRSKMAIVAGVCSAIATACRSRRESRRPQLHLVPRRVGTGLYAGATLGRTEIPIYRKSAYGLSRPHARQSIFKTIYVGRGGKSQCRRRRTIWRRIFQRCRRRAANDGDRELAGIGRTIYQEGMPDANIVACVVCHGPNAEGVGQIPRLGGLAYSYLKRRLEQWGEGYHAAAGPPMPDIASKLSPDQIEALASYLSFIP